MPRLIVPGFTISLLGLVVGLLLFMQSACSSSSDKDAWIMGKWMGDVSNTCNDSAKVVHTDSIFLRFGAEGRLQLSRLSDRSNFQTTYFTSEDEVVLASFFGGQERRLNVEGGYGDTLELSVNEGGCFHLLTLVRMDSLKSR